MEGNGVMIMSKKPGESGTRSRLLEKVAESKKKAVKGNITLRVDAALLARAKVVFEGQLGSLFEAALEDALEAKKEAKKSS